MADGIGVQTKRAEIIMLDKADDLWSKNILGDGMGKQLVETLVSVRTSLCITRGKRTSASSLDEFSNSFEVR